MEMQAFKDHTLPSWWQKKYKQKVGKKMSGNELHKSWTYRFPYSIDRRLIDWLHDEREYYKSINGGRGTGNGCFERLIRLSNMALMLYAESNRRIYFPPHEVFTMFNRKMIKCKNVICTERKMFLLNINIHKVNISKES